MTINVGTLAVTLALAKAQFERDAKTSAQAMEDLGGAVRDASGRLRDVKGRFVGAGNAMADFGATTKQATHAVRTLDTGIGDAMGSLKGYLAAWVSLQGAQQAFSLARASAELEDSTRIFEAAGGSLNDLRAATRGLISDTQLVSRANFARSIGISQEDFVKLAEVAQASSKVMAISMEEAFQRIVGGTAKMEIEILEEAGILAKIGPAVDRYAKEHKKAAGALTEAERRQAFFNEVVRQGQGLIAQAERAGANAAETYARASASLSNLAASFGNALRPAIEAVLPLLGDVAALLDHISGKDTRTSTAKLADQVRPMQQEAARLRGLAGRRGIEAGVTLQDMLAGDKAIAAARAKDITGTTRMLSQAEIASLLKRATHLEAEARKQLAEGTKAIEEAKRAASKPGSPGPRGPSEADKDFAKRLANAESGVTDFEAGMAGAAAVLGELRLRQQELAAIMPATTAELEHWASIVGFSANEQVIVIEEATRLADTIAVADRALFDFAKTSEDVAYAIIGFGNDLRDFVDKHLVPSLLNIGAGGGKAGGEQLGRVAGGAVGAVFGGSEIGAMIGGVIGSVAGNALDEIVNALGVLTPLFDGIGVVIASLQPILVVVREVFVAVGRVLSNGLAPVILQLARILGSTLGPSLVFVVRALAMLIVYVLQAVQAVLTFGEVIVGIGTLLDQALTWVANRMVDGANAFVDVINVMNNAMVSFAIGVGTLVKSMGAGDLGDAIVEAAGSVGVTLDKLDYFEPVTAQFTGDLRKFDDENTKALRDNTEAVREFGRELRNVPEVFKVDRAVANADQGERVATGPGGPFGRGPNFGRERHMPISVGNRWSNYEPAN